MRINIVPVEELMDQHLVAEYREIKMLPKMLVRSLKSKKGVNFKELPKDYTLNKGHGKFFYDKLLFIEKRFAQLLIEMDKRGFKTNSKELFMPKYDYSIIQKTSERAFEVDIVFLYNDYTPTEEALAINRERIALRISEVKNFYRYYGELQDVQ